MPGRASDRTVVFAVVFLCCDYSHVAGIVFHVAGIVFHVAGIVFHVAILAGSATVCQYQWGNELRTEHSRWMHDGGMNAPQ